MDSGKVNPIVVNRQLLSPKIQTRFEEQAFKTRLVVILTPYVILRSIRFHALGFCTDFFGPIQFHWLDVL